MFGNMEETSSELTMTGLVGVFNLKSGEWKSVHAWTRLNEQDEPVTVAVRCILLTSDSPSWNSAVPCLFCGVRSRIIITSAILSAAFN